MSLIMIIRFILSVYLAIGILMTCWIREELAESIEEYEGRDEGTFARIMCIVTPFILLPAYIISRLEGGEK